MSSIEFECMSVELSRCGRAAVLRPYGSAVVWRAHLLDQPLNELARERVPVTILDLSDLDFIGSYGLAMVILGHLRHRRHHGQIRVVAPQPGVRGVFEKTRLTVLFPVYGSIEDALENLTEENPERRTPASPTARARLRGQKSVQLERPSSSHRST